MHAQTVELVSISFAVDQLVAKLERQLEQFNFSTKYIAACVELRFALQALQQADRRASTAGQARGSGSSGDGRTPSVKLEPREEAKDCVELEPREEAKD